MRTNLAQRILIVLGALLAPLSFFVVFPPTGFLPASLSVQASSTFLIHPLLWFPRGVRTSGTIGLFLLGLGSWAILLLALVQLGLGLWTLHQFSQRVHTWSTRLASVGLVLVLLSWGGNLFVFGVMAVFGPVTLGGLLLSEMRFFSPQLIGFLLILIMRVLSRPGEPSSGSNQVLRPL